MKKVKGKKVLITGGASGIGRCTAENFARAGAELILTDIDESALEAAAKKIGELGAKVHTRVVDVADRDQVEELAAWINDGLGGLDILVNNAGIGHLGELAETNLETWRRLMAVNFWGPLHHVYAFLPSMIARKGGHIVNVSSGQAFFRLPTWGAYATIKLALGAFSEILHFEVAKHGIKVTTVYPFMVNTPFYDEVKVETFGARLSMKLLPYYSMTPERVGRIIFRAIRKEKRVEMVSIFNDVGFYSRLLPPLSNVISWTTNKFLASDSKETGPAAETRS